MSEVKVWYRSITVWTNFLALATWLLASQFGVNIPPEVGASIMSILNVILVSPQLAATTAQAEKSAKDAEAVPSKARRLKRWL